MKSLLIFVVTSLLLIGLAQVSVSGGDNIAIGQSRTIKPGNFGDEEFTVVLTAAKNGTMAVSGYMIHSGAKRKITGNLSKTGVLRANLAMGSAGTRQVPMNGTYDVANDAIFITSIDGKKTHHELARFGTKLIKVGPYSGRSIEPDMAWELTITKSSGADFNVNGFVETQGKRRQVKGTLKSRTGQIRGSAVDSDTLLIEGQYDFESHEIRVGLRVSGTLEALMADLTPGRLAMPQLFGLAEKTVGKIPDEVGFGDYKVGGIQTESSFQVDIIMKPPYEGRAKVKSEYSSQLNSTLKVGEVIELTVMSTAEKSGSYQPNLAISGFWLVEGDGAQVIEYTKTFAGTASDGKFYASSQGKTRFKVLGSGTIKITAGYWGQTWGPSGAWNWNPCTYVYKFKESPKHKVGDL